MSVTIENILTLPSLRRARVLAGRQSLDRIVSSISVLEYADTTATQDQIFESINFLGGELVITGFCSVCNDVDAQCANIKKLASAGEVGMILYYVGLILPRVDQRLIDLSDELGFVLICMPENEPGLRYSEVICEVMDAVIRDQLSSPAFSLDLLDQVSRLPKHQRTIDTTLRIVSDRLRASAAILDANSHILSASSWPRNQFTPWEAMIKAALYADSDTLLESDGLQPTWVYREELPSDISSNMTLVVFSESRRIEQPLWKQTAEGVRLAMNLWGKEHDHIAVLELVRAIIQDEPIKMRRLADIYKIDVAALSDMWILHDQGSGALSRWLGEVRALSSQYANVSICECYEGDILIFPVGPSTLHHADAWAHALADFCGANQIPAVLTRCPGLQKTSDVKNAYLTNQEYVADASAIFPNRRFFTLPEILFVKECRQAAAKGESGIAPYMSLLQMVSPGRDGADILDTLAVYLLDERSNVTETAAALFVHKNTVKYRLQKTSDILGFRVGDMPSSQELMYALGLRRLLHAAGPSD